jgi:ATP-dependent Clp protease ATP-binding subunit ClpC
MIKNQAGFGFGRRTAEAGYENMKEMLSKEVERYFRPEFLNRVDELIVFKSLTREDLYQIVELELKKVRGRLADHGLKLELTKPAIDFLIDKGYNPDFGARPLRRAIVTHLEDPLSEQILRGHFKGKKVILVGAKDEELFFDADSADEHPLHEPAHKGASNTH